MIGLSPLGASSNAITNVPDSPIGEQSEQVYDGYAKRRGYCVFDVLDLSAQVCAHDNSVPLQFVQLLNQNLLAGARN